MSLERFLKSICWCAADFVLRFLSHYRAFRGPRAMLRSGGVEFKGLPELRTLEENLQAPEFNRTGIHAIAENLKIGGLEQFLERMV